jgi:rare lipoprotein A (peptidoglycan hydrolase)
MHHRHTGGLIGLALLLAIASSAPGLWPAGAEAQSYERVPFGARELRRGDQGTDVKTLNWALRAEALGTPRYGSFIDQTDWAVRTLQREAGIAADGVVRRTTRKALAARMPRQRATWYGPGLYGNRTACGQKLRKKTIGVAHRKLPCGTPVVFAYKGRWVRAKVIDRGPFRRGYRWDLTERLARSLGAINAGTVSVKAAASP